MIMLRSLGTWFHANCAIFHISRFQCDNNDDKFKAVLIHTVDGNNRKRNTPSAQRTLAIYPTCEPVKVCVETEEKQLSGEYYVCRNVLIFNVDAMAITKYVFIRKNTKYKSTRNVTPHVSKSHKAQCSRASIRKLSPTTVVTKQ